MHSFDDTTIANFWQRVVIPDGENECWGWTGTLKDDAAYMSIHKKWYTAAKISWLIHYGDIPEDGRVKKTCGNPACSNPKHLQMYGKSTEEERFWARINITDDDHSCWEWQGSIGGNGYGHLYHDGVVVQAHRLAYEFEHGPIPDGLFILHKCDNRLCCRVSHLFLGTLQDNHADMVAKKRHTWGENHPGAQLNWEQVREIRERLENGETGRSIAKEYGLSTATISNIRTKTTWRE